MSEKLLQKIEIEDEEDFFYLNVNELPLLWKIKIRGDRYKKGRCPYDGAELTKIEKPIDHLHCLGLCGRNYVREG